MLDYYPEKLSAERLLACYELAPPRAQDNLNLMDWAEQMIKEITAKASLSYFKQPYTWFWVKYNINLYRGCQYQCVYCDSRSECYQIENFSDVLVKTNAIELLRKELSRMRPYAAETASQLRLF